jgi:hypothetical protein
LTLVDDYGRFDGRPAVLHGQCFSVWNECNPKKVVDLQQVERMLQQLAVKQLLDWFEIDGKKVVQVIQWQERIREGTRSKWPERTEVAASCCKLLLPTPPPSPSPVSIASGASPPAGAFKKPTIEEVKLQASKTGVSDLDAEKFFNYQTSKGWKVGNSPMKSWTHALVTWKLNGQSYGNYKNSPKSNPRNDGIAFDPAEAGRQTAEVIARRQRERQSHESV